MKVKKENCAENVAFQKDASQSSTMGDKVASNAVSGQNSPGASTKPGDSLVVHWWQVDFGSLKMIQEIHIRIRFRHSGGVFNVLLANSSTFEDSQTCHNIENNEKLDAVKALSFKCVNRNIAAQYLKVEFANTDALSIQEITVFGWEI